MIKEKVRYAICDPEDHSKILWITDTAPKEGEIWRGFVKPLPCEKFQGERGGCATCDGKCLEFEEKATYINVTPHPIVFRSENSEEFTVPPSGRMCSARPVEKEVRKENGISFVATSFEGDERGWEEIREIRAENPDAIIIGSIISAQAYPGEIVAMTPALGFERVSPAEKRMNPLKFTIFKKKEKK